MSDHKKCKSVLLVYRDGSPAFIRCETPRHSGSKHQGSGLEWDDPKTSKES